MTAAPNLPRRVGRKPGARTRTFKSLRMTDIMKAAIERRAASHQRSLSEEIEAILETAVYEQQADGGPELSRLKHLLRDAFRADGEAAARAKFGYVPKATAWRFDPWCYVQACAAVGRELHRIGACLHHSRS